MFPFTLTRKHKEGITMEKTEKQGLLKRILEWIERKGNRIPQPTTLFVILAIVIVLSSELLFRLGVSVQINVFDSKVNELVLKEVTVKSLLSPDGVRFMFEKAVTNFTNFAPVGIVLVTLFGIAAADGTGLLNALVKKILWGLCQILQVMLVTFWYFLLRGLYTNRLGKIHLLE